MLRSMPFPVAISAIGGPGACLINQHLSCSPRFGSNPIIYIIGVFQVNSG
jgi:hypothetical protein